MRVFCRRKLKKQRKIKKSVKKMKKGVDEQRMIWYYSQAPYEKAHGKSEAEAERKPVRTLKIKQRKRRRNP